MKRLIIVLALAACALCAQDPKDRLRKLAGDLDVAIQNGNWKKAAELSAEIDAAVQTARDQSLTKTAMEFTDSLLAWLPVDTETLVVASTPFKVQSGDEKSRLTTLDTARGYMLGLLEAAEGEDLFKRLTGQTIRTAALAARKFGEEPDSSTGDQRRGLGMIPYAGCALYSFAQPLPKPLMRRQPDETVAGHEVWRSKGSQSDGKDTETFRVSVLDPDILISCNQADFLREILSRRGLPHQTRALPPTLPEWKYVDRTAPVWGISHYRDSGFLGLVGFNIDRATGLTVAFGVAGGTRARMLTAKNPWNEIVDSPDFQSKAHFREHSRGVWELNVDEKDSDVGGFSVLMLMGMLGFVVAI